MNKVIKAIFLQLYWYVIVYYGSEFQNILLVTSFILVGLNFIILKPQITKGHYVFTLILFILYGLVEESIFSAIGLVDYHQESFPLWFTSLWMMFLCYYGDIFNYLASKSWILHFFLGGIGGVFAFYGGTKISSIEAMTSYYYVAIFFSWAVFYPLSMKVFYGGFMWNKILDFSIIYSFDQTGFERHKEEYFKNITSDKNEKFLITGGTSGIGHALAKDLERLGDDILVTGRDEKKGNECVTDHISFLSFDMAELSSIKDFVKKLPTFDGVVLNAGGMTETFKLTKYQIEQQACVQLFGHFLLLEEMINQNKLKDSGRVVWVSSGGMYLKGLNLRAFFEDIGQDKVSQYAYIKRAQVSLLNQLAKRYENHKIFGMHPGWVDTAAVRNFIPGFYEKMKERLRSPREGADTILWLLKDRDNKQSGEFFFDRKKVRKSIYGLFHADKKQQEKLMNLLVESKTHLS